MRGAALGCTHPPSKPIAITAASAGGLSTSEIPQFRLPVDAVEYEVRLMRSLGVKVEHGRVLGKGLSLESLRKDGYEAIFVGIGRQLPVVLDVFKVSKPCERARTRTHARVSTLLSSLRCSSDSLGCQPTGRSRSPFVNVADTRAFVRA